MCPDGRETINQESAATIDEDGCYIVLRGFVFGPVEEATYDEEAKGWRFDPPVSAGQFMKGDVVKGMLLREEVRFADARAACCRELRGLYHVYICPTCLWYNRLLPLLRRLAR